MTDPYAPCPCGSGKKFKWCCQPIHQYVDKAYQQESAGQHDAALRTLDEAVAAFPDNPEPLGRKAQLLYSIDRFEEAEAELEKAFKISPNYPFGHYLKGRFRMIEGEFAGAVILLRKAIELYDPGARPTLAALWAAVAECESRLNRPIASRAALELAVKFDPTTPSYKQAMQEAYGPEAPLPEAAKAAYAYKGPAASAPPERQQAWQKALATQTVSRLSEAAKAFGELTAQDPSDAAAWYNLALTRGWQGDNAGALQALNEYAGRESDPQAVAAAWTLGEVLRCGPGLEDGEADYVEHSLMYQFRDGKKISDMLQALEKEERLAGTRVSQQEQMLTSIVLEKPTLLGAQTARAPRFAAHLLIVGNVLRLWCTNREQLEKVGRDVAEKAGGTLGQPVPDRRPVFFSDVLMESLVFPVTATNEEEAGAAIAEGMAKFFEDAWVHRPLRSLGNVAPVDAAGHGVLRNKLAGVVDFLEQCGQTQKMTYDFNRLRRKLGLLQPAPGQATATASAAGQDVSAMGAAELAALQAGTLSEEQLEEAYRTAQRLDAQELATAFLQELVARPVGAGRGDRFPWYTQLIQRALAGGDADAALGHVDAGEKLDCEHNEGRRRNDYELWRGRVQAKRGDIDAAQDVFDRLVERAPAELRYRGTAAEAMLGAKQPARALKFAQDGLAQARKQQNRDSEQYFLELSEAAQRQAK